jgi:hypothetical protein
MPTYKVDASRVVYYDLIIEAESEQEALDKVKNIDEAMDMEDYWGGEDSLQINSIGVM